MNYLAIAGAGLAAYGVYSGSNTMAYVGIAVLLFLGCGGTDILSGFQGTTQG